MYLAGLPVLLLGAAVCLRNFVQSFTYMKYKRLWSKWETLFAPAGTGRRDGLPLLCWLTGGSYRVLVPPGVWKCSSRWGEWWPVCNADDRRQQDRL